MQHWVISEKLIQSLLSHRFMHSHLGAGAEEALSKTDTGMVNEVLCKLLCHNLTCWIQDQEIPGIAPMFRKDESLSTEGDIFPMRRLNGSYCLGG